MTTAAVYTKLLMDSTDFESKIKRAGAGVRALSGLSKVGGAILGSAFTVAAAGVAVLTRELYTDIQVGMEAERVQSQLYAVLKSTGGIAGVTAKQINAYADKMSLLTGIDDEAITSAQSMLLTFTSIGKDVFPKASDAVLNMSTAMNGGLIPTAEQLRQTTILLGKALQDPDAGLGALKRVGVNVEELKKRFTPLMSVEQKQILILQELATEFGGSAEAAGKTFVGQLAILKIQLDNIRETIFTKLQPVLMNLAKTFNEYLSRPETIAFIQMVADKLASFASWAVSQLPIVAANIYSVFGWLANNQGVIVGALAAISAAVLTFVVPAFVTAASAAWPVVAVMTAVGVVAYFVYQAWAANFGGIQQILKRFAAFALDMFFRIRFHLVNALPKAIVFLRDAWEKYFIPTIQKVVMWAQKYLLPVLMSVGRFLSAVFAVDVTLAGMYLNKILIPAFQGLGKILAFVWPYLVMAGKFIATYWTGALMNIGKVLDWLTTKLKTFNRYLMSLDVSKTFKPGSPTPFEMGLRGINDAMSQLNNSTLPSFSSGLNLSPSGTPAMGGNGGANRTINLTVNAQDMSMKKVIEIIDQRQEATVEALIQAITGA